jgi:hypothetical protein
VEWWQLWSSGNNSSIHNGRLLDNPIDPVQTQREIHHNERNIANR